MSYLQRTYSIMIFVQRLFYSWAPVISSALKMRITLIGTCLVFTRYFYMAFKFFPWALPYIHSTSVITYVSMSHHCTYLGSSSFKGENRILRRRIAPRRHGADEWTPLYKRQADITVQQESINSVVIFMETDLALLYRSNDTGRSDARSVILNRAIHIIS